MSVKRDRCRVAGVLLAGVCAVSATHAATPCAAAQEPALELRVVAAALAPELDRSLVVGVFDDGCVQVHRPAYRRDAGEFRLDLAPEALAALKRTVAQPALRAFDAQRVRADIAAAQSKRASAEGKPQRFSELDADRYEIRWRDGAKRGGAAWNGLPGEAKAVADNAALQAFANAAMALQLLAERADAQRIEGERP